MVHWNQIDPAFSFLFWKGEAYWTTPSEGGKAWRGTYRTVHDESAQAKQFDTMNGGTEMKNWKRLLSVVLTLVLVLGMLPMTAMAQELDLSQIPETFGLGDYLKEQLKQSVEKAVEELGVPLKEILEKAQIEFETFLGKISSYQLVSVELSGKAAEAATADNVQINEALCFKIGNKWWTITDQEVTAVTVGKLSIDAETEGYQFEAQKADTLVLNLIEVQVADAAEEETPVEPPVGPEEPSAPTAEEVKAVFKQGNGTIFVQCATEEAGHAERAFKELLDDSFVIGEVSYGSVAVTVYAEKYVSAYAEEKDAAHNVVGDTSGVLQLTYSDGAWSMPTYSNMIFTVACEGKEPVVEYYTVAFDSNGGSAVASQKVEEGKTATRPVDPTRDGYTFAGWLLNGTAYEFNMAVSGDLTLVADWKADPVPPVEPEVETITVKFVLPVSASWVDKTVGAKEYSVTSADKSEQKAPLATDFYSASNQAFQEWKTKSGKVLSGGAALKYDELKAYAVNGVVTFYAVFETVEVVPSADIYVKFYIGSKDHADFKVGSKYVDTYGYWAEYGDTVDLLTVVPETGYKVTGWVVEGDETYYFNRWTEAIDNIGEYAKLDRANNKGYVSIRPIVEQKTAVVLLNKDDHDAYIEGYGDDTVRPENNITRAEIATIFYRLLTDESRAAYKSTRNSFSDVSSGDWFNTAVSTLAKAGVMGGYPDGTFRPNAAITRAELAAVVANFVEWDSGYTTYFYDVDGRHWASEEIAIARYFGWIEGYGDGSYRPDAKITRAETVTLINRVLERAVEADGMLKGMVTFDDCDPDAWYYEAIQEAANSHTYTRTHQRVSGQSYCYESWVRLLN